MNQAKLNKNNEMDVAITAPPVRYLSSQWEQVEAVLANEKWEVAETDDIEHAIFPHFRQDLISILLTDEEQAELNRKMTAEIGQFFDWKLIRSDCFV